MLPTCLSLKYYTYVKYASYTYMPIYIYNTYTHTYIHTCVMCAYMHVYILNQTDKYIFCSCSQ